MVCNGTKSILASCTLSPLKVDILYIVRTQLRSIELKNTILYEAVNLANSPYYPPRKGGYEGFKKLQQPSIFVRSKILRQSYKLGLPRMQSPNSLRDRQGYLRVCISPV